MLCETQYAYACHNQRHVSLNIIIIVSKNLNETSYNVQKRTDHQYSATVEHSTMSNVQNVHLS